MVRTILILKIRKLKSVGGGSIDIQLKKVVGGEGGEGGSIDIQLRKVGREVGKGGGVHRHSIQESFRWGERGGEGGLIDGQLGKDP